MLIYRDSHCALIAVMELATNHERTGVTIEQVSERYHISMEYMEPVVTKLCAADIISCENITNDMNCFFLRRDPHEIFAYEIIQVFDGELFCGKFMDESTGKWFRESSASRLINFERKHYELSARQAQKDKYKTLV